MSSKFLQSHDFRERLRSELLIYDKILKTFDALQLNENNIDHMVEDYNNFIFDFVIRGKGDNIKSANIANHVKLLWRIHLQHPLIYRRDCFKHFGKLILPNMLIFEFNDTTQQMNIPISTQKITTLDLKKSLLKHLDFMQKIFDERDFWFIEQNIDNAVMEYVHFMKLAGYKGLNQDAMVPSIYADFIWHIHMLHPLNYHKESQILANGNIVCQYDTMNDIKTQSKWQNIFKYKSRKRSKMKCYGALMALLLAILISLYKMYQINEQFEINSNRRRLIGRYSGALFMFLIILFIMGIISIVLYCDAFFVDIDAYTSGGCGGRCSNNGGDAGE